MIDLIHNRAQVTVPFPEPLSTTSTSRTYRSSTQLPPHQSQEAPTRQSAALLHSAVLDTSGSCFAVLIIQLTISRTAALPINPLHLIPAPHTPVYPPPLTPAAGPKYHRPHPQQSAGHSPLSRPLLHHINRQDIGHL